jgi:hypothetical protein
MEDVKFIVRLGVDIDCEKHEFSDLSSTKNYIETLKDLGKAHVDIIYKGFYITTKHPLTIKYLETSDIARILKKYVPKLFMK